MSDKPLVLSLAKVIIAAAWADGEISSAEVDSLKDLLFWLPHANARGNTILTSREWASLEMYIESPVEPAERKRLLHELQQRLKTESERHLAITSLESILKADGVVTDEEEAVLTEIKQAIAKVDTDFFTRLNQLVSGAIQRRTEAVANAPNREEHFEDFIKNKVYYVVQRRLHAEGKTLDIPDDTLRKLSLAGALMAQIARIDQEVVETEMAAIVKAFRENWDLSEETAVFVAEVAVAEGESDLDSYRMTREFYDQTTEEERLRFLDVMLTVAVADQGISFEESENIRRLARSLHIDQRQFITAKNRVEQ